MTRYIFDSINSIINDIYFYFYFYLYDSHFT